MVLPAVGVLICINTTNAADPIRDFVILPSALVNTDTASQPFHPDFLAHMAGSTIINFGPWLKTEYQNTCVGFGSQVERALLQGLSASPTFSGLLPRRPLCSRCANLGVLV